MKTLILNKRIKSEEYIKELKDLAIKTYNKSQHLQQLAKMCGGVVFQIDGRRSKVTVEVKKG